MVLPVFVYNDIQVFIFRSLLIHLIGPISLFIVTMLYLKFFYDLWCPFVTAIPNATDNDIATGISNGKLF